MCSWIQFGTVKRSIMWANKVVIPRVKSRRNCKFDFNQVFIVSAWANVCIEYDGKYF
jgi:hypothetical protein